MKVDVVRAPLLVGSVIGGVLILRVLLAILTGSSFWDDHLINALGVFTACGLISLVLWLVVGAFRPPPGTSRRARVIKFVLLLTLIVVGGVVLAIALFLANLSFV